MKRKIARIVRVDSLTAIRGADLIETAHVGGWACVVKKGVFKPADLAVYFEIDAFLPQGNPAWDFLVAQRPTVFNGQTGHALRSVRLKKQLSQGLLLPLTDFPQLATRAGQPLPFHQVPWTDEPPWFVGEDVSALLGVGKYEHPMSEDLAKIARGYMPSGVPTTDQERIQNLAEELVLWQQAGEAGHLTWEKTEKLEGESCSFILLDDEFRVCSRRVDLKPVEGNANWAVAKALRVEDKLRAYFRDRPVALQGELVGPGLEGNIYRLEKPMFYLYDVFDIGAGRTFSPKERRALAHELDILHVPVLSTYETLDASCAMDVLLAKADGESALRKGCRREGEVYKANEEPVSFKVVSNAYLMGEKL